jgi:hypothetical protein
LIKKNRIFVAAAMALTVVLAACGGGGGDSAPPPAAAIPAGIAGDYRTLSTLVEIIGMKTGWFRPTGKQIVFPAGYANDVWDITPLALDALYAVGAFFQSNARKPGR